MTRRDLLRFGLAGALGGAAEFTINTINRGSLLAQYVALGRGVANHSLRRFNGAVLPAKNYPDWYVRAQTADSLGQSNIVKDLGDNFSTFFTEPDLWAEQLSLTLNIFDLSPRTAIPVFCHWSKNKTGGFLKQMSEKAVMGLQTHIATASNLPGVRELLTNLGVPGKAMIQARTFGFYDKGPTVCAKAVMHAIGKNQTDSAFWNNLVGKDSFVELCEGHISLRTKIDSIKQAENVIETPYDALFIKSALELESMLMGVNHDMRVQMALTGAALSRQQDLWIDAYPGFTDLQPALQSFLLMVNSDFYPYHFPQDFNPRTEFDFFPPEPVTLSASSILDSTLKQNVNMFSAFINETNRQYPGTSGDMLLHDYAKAAVYANAL